MNSTSADPGVFEERCGRLERQISTQKHVSSLRKSLLELRERQTKDLISKLKLYEVLVTEEREARHNLSNSLENAEGQCIQLTEKLTKNLQTIEDIKGNDENKVSTLISEIQTAEERNQKLSDQLNCAQLRLRISKVTKDYTMEELQRKLEEANKSLEEKDRFAKEMQKQLKRVWDRNKMLTYQMSLLNNLFSETEGVTIDFEKIKTIGDIVRESQSYTDETEEGQSDDEFSERRASVDLEHLLDSMEKSEDIAQADIPGEESCYKSVDTKRGPELVLSVSKTFIKLKDLILEKKSLQKDIDTLKNLNTKLESKVDKQEHRLYRVTMELNKTWSLVSKLKQQHKKLYNSEAVLRYELQEKRALLEKLKNELSSSREKWRRVRQKNSASQVEWEKLRDEFAQRKHQSSQESGTFSEVVSVSSSGENEPAPEDEAGLAGSARRRNSRGNSVEKSNTLPKSFTTTVVSTTPSDTTTMVVAVEEAASPIPILPSNSEEHEQEDDAIPAEDDEPEEGAGVLSSVEDESFSEPLEELVSQLVEDIDNEADTEEVSTTSSASARVQLESDSSPSPDFEDRMRRRADRLRMLEEQCHILHQKLMASTERQVALSTKLADLHDHYGPSGSSTTGTPNDHQQQQGDHQTSQTQDEVSAHIPSNSAATDEETTSTDAAYVSGPESSSVRGEEDCQANLNEPEKQRENDAADADAGEGSTSLPPIPITPSSEGKETTESGASKSTDDELISASENSPAKLASAPCAAEVAENNKNPSDEQQLDETMPQSKQSQGHPNDDDEEAEIVAVAKADVDNSLLTTVKGAAVSSPPFSTETSEHSRSTNVEGDSNPNPTHPCPDSLVTTTTVAAAASPSPTINDELALANVNSAEASSRDSGRQQSENNGAAEGILNCDGNGETEDESVLRHHHLHHRDGSRTEQASLTSEQISNSNVEIRGEEAAASSSSSPHNQPELSEEILVVEEPLPIIQETVVQHFPATSEEEANEFAPVQIRPEFLRILQEADEATNVSSLDWMPSLLTITHSVALLRLDHDSPTTARHNNNRSLSESLRIEIPRQSPSPPPAPPHHHHRQRQEENGGSSGTNHNDGHVSTDEELETEKLRASTSAKRKDPGFLSRMIIKQLPKRLQLLKNENHTLQMEAVETEMRMKEMKRQLTKEVEKQQQLANSLDVQIEDKNLVEFELREELETKEKVIDQLQVEIDVSKNYIDELKKEKDDIEAFLKVFVEEKVDMGRPKTAPESVKNCNNCKRPFSLVTRRKVHCKICGKVFCKDCALQREPEKRTSKRPRLCTRCHLRRLRLVVLVNASKQPSAQPN